MKAPVTASMLYDLDSCPHRVTMDLFGDPAERDAPNPFVQMLWEKGTLFEKETIAGLDLPFLDLSTHAGDEKERLTTEAMRRGEPLIYGGRICEGDLLGDPDLLRREGAGYVAGDIKSGSGEEGPADDSKPKKHYAVQLALYTDILERKGLSAGRRAFVWDIHGNEVPYEFTAHQGARNPRTLWDDYLECLGEARAIIGEQTQTLPASSAVCKLCPWYSPCLKRLVDTDDLTLIPELGGSRRDTMISRLPTVSALAKANPSDFIDGKKTVFPGIGPDTLRKFVQRGKLQISSESKPLHLDHLRLPDHDLELFFDVEVDPMRDVCYLHGFVERRGRDNSTETYVSFFADKPTTEAEGKAFAAAWGYLAKCRPCTIYYYSKYERTIYRQLQGKHPEVCTADQIEELFDPAHAVDLYFGVVKKQTEWPTRD